MARKYPVTPKSTELVQKIVRETAKRAPTPEIRKSWRAALNPPKQGGPGR
ncbi:MAG: hypothetical protein AB1679_00045 [Actinomycetota bacterium]